MQNTTRLLILASALSFGLSHTVFAQTVRLGESVQGLLDYARSRNPDYAAMRHEASASHERIIPAGALPDPKFRIELRDITRMGEQSPSVSPSQVGSTRYRLMQEIPWFGKRDLKREIAELEAIAARSSASDSLFDLSTQIKTRYAQLFFLHHNQKISREILTLLQQLEKVAQVRYSNGLAAQQDVVRAQVEQTLVESELVMLDNEFVQAESNLNALLSRPASAPLGKPEHLRNLPPTTQLSLTSLEDRVRQNNPLLTAEEARLKAADKSRELVYKNRYPDFSVGLSSVQNGSSFKEWGLMVELNIPLQQSSRRAREREAAAKLNAARARKTAATNSVVSELASSLSALESTRRIEKLAATSLLPQAELTFQSALAGYENGKVDFATLLDSQKQILMAKRSLLKAQAEGQIRLAEIEKLTGENF